MTKKEYCLVIEEKERDNNIEIVKEFMGDLTDIINCLDFDEKVNKVKIFRSDNL